MNRLPDTFVSFDLECVRYHSQVEGGWNNIEGFGMSCAVTHSKADGYRHYFANDLPDLLEYLRDAPLVVGFNLKGFDYKVLAGAIEEMVSEAGVDDETVRRLSAANLKKIRTFDILEEIRRSLGHNVKLKMLALANFNTRRDNNLRKAVDYWKEGDKVKVKDYCEKDVEIARELFIKAVSKKHLLWHWWNREDRVENLDTSHWGEKAISIMGCEPTETPLKSSIDISNDISLTLSIDLSLTMKDESGDGEMTHDQDRAVLGLLESIQHTCETLRSLGSPVEVSGLEASIKRKFGNRSLQT